MTQSPKSRFQQFPAALAHHEKLVQSEHFDTAVTYAMAEFTERLSRSKIGDMNSAAYVGCAISGATDFLNILKELAQKPLPNQVPIKDNLEN